MAIPFRDVRAEAGSSIGKWDEPRRRASHRSPLARRSLLIQSAASAPVAQLDRVPGYEPGGRGFESCRARQQSST